MTTLAFQLHPLDLLFFRDAHPFGAAEQGRSRMPLPQTWAGLIKTHLTHTVFQGNPRVWHGGHDHNRPREEWPWQCRLRFRGPWLWLHESQQLPTRGINSTSQEETLTPAGPLVPAPADLIQTGGNNETQLSRIQPLPADLAQRIGWRPLPKCEELVPLWHAGKETARPVSGWLDRVGLQTYLQGKVPAKENVHELSRFVESESRTGIGIDPSRLTADKERGLIYSAVFLRLQHNVCFYAEVDWPDGAPACEEIFPEGLHLPWGGEGRRVLLQQTAPWNWSELEAKPESGRLLTLLVTPGLFFNAQHRWKPQERGSLISAAVPHPLPVSGWDLAGDQENGNRPRPRPTRFAVPSGAVYMWRQGGRTRDQPPPERPESLCDKPSDQDAGWGLALRGTWNTLE